MENFSNHVPFYVVTGGVATTGHSSELTAGQVGLIDRQTWSVATASGNGKEFFFAQGNYGGKDWSGAPISNTHKGPYFLAKDVKNIYKSLPQRITNEEWVLGYDGSASSVGLRYEKGKSLKVKFYFYGDPIYRKFAGPKEYVISYTPEQDCTDDNCDDSCGPDALDCRPHTSKLIDKINNHVELKQFGVTAKLKSDLFVAATTNMTKWALSVCDNGDALALQAVQAQYPGAKITRTSRAGSTSTYSFCASDDNSDPSDFTQEGSVSLAICQSCSTFTNATAVGAVDGYLVTRALAGTEDFTTEGSRQTFADTIGTAYETALAKTFNGATAVEVVAASDAITITSHGFTSGNKVVYANGGGTSVVGLTTTNTYYIIRVDANIVKLASTYENAIAGTAIAIADGVGASHTLTPTITAAFLSNNVSTVTVGIKIPSGIVLTPVLADVTEFGATEGARCEFDAPEDIAWSNVGSGISSERTLKTKLARPDCNASGDRLADLTALLSEFIDVDIESLTKIAGDACVDEYTITQFSNDCLEEGCLTSNVTFTYNTLPSLDGAVWTEVPSVPTENTAAKCGIVLTAGYIDPKFGNCSFNPFDYYNNEPIRMEISLLDEDAGNCAYGTLPSVFQTRKGTIARQSGEYIVREVLMKTAAYQKHIEQFSFDTRTREAFDMNLLSSVDRNAFYILYYVTVNANYNGLDRKNEQEKFTHVFAVKESDASQFNLESGPLAILQGKSGVALHINS